MTLSLQEPSVSGETESNVEESRRQARQRQKIKEFQAARNVYIVIIMSFITVCTVAVVLSIQLEANKKGFQAIETTRPVSFFDKTYMKKK
jgi:ABC-type Fe3+ transport system permease subunit